LGGWVPLVYCHSVDGGWKRGVVVVKRILYMCIYVYKYIFFILLTGRKFGGAIVLKIHLTVFEVVYYSFVR
jgi:hypothetical protein